MSFYSAAATGVAGHAIIDRAAKLGAKYGFDNPQIIAMMRKGSNLIMSGKVKDKNAKILAEINKDVNDQFGLQLSKSA